MLADIALDVLTGIAGGLVAWYLRRRGPARPRSAAA
jgi:hypothetical protein